MSGTFTSGASTVFGFPQHEKKSTLSIPGLDLAFAAIFGFSASIVAFGGAARLQHGMQSPANQPLALGVGISGFGTLISGFSSSGVLMSALISGFFSS